MTAEKNILGALGCKNKRNTEKPVATGFSTFNAPLQAQRLTTMFVYMATSFGWHLSRSPRNSGRIQIAHLEIGGLVNTFRSSGFSTLNAPLYVRAQLVMAMILCMAKPPFLGLIFEPFPEQLS